MIDQPTQTTQTKLAYQKRFHQLARRFLGSDVEINIDCLVDKLLDWKYFEDPSRNTWWQYKSAMMASIDPGSRAYARLKKEKQPAHCKRGKVGKARSISARSRKYLEKVINKHCRPKMVERILTFMEAGVLTGLRPGEWENAELKLNRCSIILCVRNAKHTNGRAHGEWRFMEITTEEGLELVLRHFRYMEEFVKGSRHPNGIEGGSGHKRNRKDYFESVREAMWRAYKKEAEVEKKRGIKHRPPTLVPYSARHQFKNDARAAGLPDIEIGYLMGHASVETHQRHYGRRRSSNSGFGVRRASKMPQVLIDSKAKVDQKRSERRFNNRTTTRLMQTLDD